jgi:hypothetical protein
VYLPVVRHYASYMQQEFDFAASSLVVGQRAETTTAQQALFFLNNDFILEQAEATAKRLISQAPDDIDQQLRLAYRYILSRPPTTAERTLSSEFLQRTSETLRESEQDPRARHAMGLACLVQTLFGSVEFRYLIHAPTADRETQKSLAKADSP